MSTAFFEKSKEIANGFLQSIVFLDDRAFGNNVVTGSEQNNSQHAFDSFEISKVFAKEKKVCAVYNPLTTSDIDDFKEISKKADVVILDWYIEIQEVVVGEDLMLDAEEDEPRGQYTKQIITELISNFGNNGLKLIVIYTGEDILEDITQNIYDHISPQNEQFTLIQPNCEVCSANIRILIRAKSSGEAEDTRFNQRPHLRDKILRYEDLPSFVLNELTVMTSGLLSNFALLSLTTIRNNSHKILGLFSKELDPAYLGHKVLLPHHEDAEDLLYDIMRDSLTDLLSYNGTARHITKELINDWFSQHIKEENLSVRNKNGTELNPTVSFLRNIELLNKLLFSEEKKVDKKINALLRDLITDKNQREDFIKYLFKNSTLLFENSNNISQVENINKQFAILTHHKTLFIPHTAARILTLGTIIKSSTTQDDYFICIQQKCDSVRLQKDETRKYLFLPLTKTTDNEFHIITPEGIKLKLDKKSYAIKTIKFKCNCDYGVVKGVFDNGKYTFKEIYQKGDTFEWVLDLKDLHSQRIVTNYVSSLSRVGLDESEWLRIAGN